MSDQNDTIIERFHLTRSGYNILIGDLQAMKVHREGMLDAQADGVNDYHDNIRSELSSFLDFKTSSEHLDERIENLEFILQRADVLDKEDPNPKMIDPGEIVTLYDYVKNEEVRYRLLNTTEVAYGIEGISVESPVGLALVGKHVGDIVEVTVPDGIAHYAVRRIERPV